MMVASVLIAAGALAATAPAVTVNAQSVDTVRSVVVDSLVLRGFAVIRVEATSDRMVRVSLQTERGRTAVSPPIFPDSIARWSNIVTRAAAIPDSIRREGAQPLGNALVFRREWVDTAHVLRLDIPESDGTPFSVRLWPSQMQRIAVSLEHAAVVATTLPTEAFATQPNLGRRDAERSRFETAYPLRLRQQEITGRVRMSFVIDTTGAVDLATVQIYESTHPEFTRSAWASIRGARFRPAMILNRPVRTLANVPITYDIRLPGEGSFPQRIGPP